MVTGRRVFQGVTATGELIAAHLSARPPSPRMIDPSISPGLEAIILRMIAKRPEERYQTMHEVHADLERVARGSASLATPHQPADVPTLVPEVAHVPAQSSQPTTLGGVASQAIAPRRARRRPLAIVAGAGLVVAGAGTIAVVAATRDGSNASTSSTAASGDAPADPAPSGVTDAPAVQPSPVASPAPVASIDAGSPAGMPSPAIATPASTPSPAETPPSEARPKDKDAPKRTRPTRTRPTASPTPSPSASPEPPSDDEPLDEHRIK
jgi:serine/threonine-protein kinase